MQKRKPKSNQVYAFSLLTVYLTLNHFLSSFLILNRCILSVFPIQKYYILSVFPRDLDVILSVFPRFNISYSRFTQNLPQKSSVSKTTHRHGFVPIFIIKRYEKRHLTDQTKQKKRETKEHKLLDFSLEILFCSCDLKRQHS